ncbi:MAG: DEAD/DEAH box helicase [Lachnospiraceae bacterium]|nr:DEAD/DEAH box helicase [Lachnospiraceae bacterium]
MTYEQSGLDPRILRAVAELGFESMTPIQQQAIPVFLEGKDLIGQAQTGTGKTAAFGIPILQKVDPDTKGLQALVLCPTRELAIQAAEEIRKFGKYMEGIKVLPIYGGQDITKQIRSLKGNVQIVVGTPGRVMDHMRRHTLKLKGLKMIVLDEADEMLNMGFREDIETILQDIPGEHQTGLFSATMPKPILDITKTYQRPDAVMVKVAAKELTIPLVRQYYYEVRLKNKEEVTARILDYYNPKRTLIFCNTKRKVDELAEVLKGRGYFAEGFHGDMSQAQRDKIMNGFRKGFVDILIATDVAARGIDVDDVEAVFNYDIPQDIEYYVHRIGRTGRAGKSGRAFTLVVGRDIYKIRDIERVCKTKIKPRSVPSAVDINSAKADKVIKEAVNHIKEDNLYSMIKIVEAKLDDEDFTAMELAAALLKMQMGNEVVEMQLDYSWFDSDEYKDKKRKSRGFGRREGRGRNRGRHDDKNNAHSESRRDDKNNTRGESKRDDKNNNRSESRRGNKRDERSKYNRRGGRNGEKRNEKRGNVKRDAFGNRINTK